MCWGVAPRIQDSSGETWWRVRKGNEWICLLRNCGANWEALYETEGDFREPGRLSHTSTPPLTQSLQLPEPGPPWPCHPLSILAPPSLASRREPAPCLPASRRRPGIWTSSKFPWVRHLSRVAPNSWVMVVMFRLLAAEQFLFLAK